ncbi:MAG TPA: lysophospholipid acyltransferase family protein [Phycisphaerae bacterium]|nr:lysophospholipid acyltransferase family protein [Phycisphaerae bacterium]
MNGLQRVWYTLVQQVARVVCILAFGLRVEHRDRFPKKGGVLVVANHQSFLDPILVAVGLPRPFHPMARDSLFRLAPFRWLIRSLGAFPVRRGTADLNAVRGTLRRLRKGAVVLMFPEATRTRDGSIGPLQGGPATIAARAGVPILPMVIEGAFQAWPRTRLLPQPHPIRVAYGKAVRVENITVTDPKETMAAVRRQMVDIQKELRRRLRAGA